MSPSLTTKPVLPARTVEAILMPGDAKILRSGGKKKRKKEKESLMLVFDGADVYYLVCCVESVANKIMQRSCRAEHGSQEQGGAAERRGLGAARREHTFPPPSSPNQPACASRLTLP